MLIERLDLQKTMLSKIKYNRLTEDKEITEENADKEIGLRRGECFCWTYSLKAEREFGLTEEIGEG
jgi:hypothetical protein